IEKATSEKNISEEWGKIMDICDKVGFSTQNAKDCLRSIVKRLCSPDPHIVMQALTLLDACVSNCGKIFHLEIASREFENDLRKLINHSEPKIAERMRGLLKKWAEGDFKTDPQLNLIPSLFNKLKNEGYDFTSISDTPKRTTVLNKDPNVVTDSQEEEDIAKAIELSLKESKVHSQASSSHSSPASKKNTSLYPNVSSALGTLSNSEGRKVRALYDFEAAEANELTFFAGEISMIHIQLEHSNKKMVQFAEEVEVKTVKREPEVIEVEIDERKMDRLLHLLHEADPQCDNSDPQEMLDLEEQVTAMGPLIDAALEKVDRRHAQLTQLSSDLVDALNLYHTLMREPPPPTPSNYTLPKMPPHINPYQFQSQGPPPPHIYNGVPPPHQASFSVGSGPSGPYNTNIPTNDMGPVSMPNITLPQHFHVQPPGPHQHPPGHSQGPPVPEQSNLPYSHQGYPPQTGPMPGPYGPPRPTGPPVNQQPQYAPSNGQHMM
ncbi:Signal transducing adapter molecule 1, partial [Habropoda laboriosa]